MADIELNALETRGESTMAVIIEDDIEKIHEASETSHEATEANREATVASSHEATVQTEGELRSTNIEVKERKKTSDIWTYFKIDSSDIKKAVCLTCEERVSRGGSIPTKFNTSNLRKHLMIHKDQFHSLLEEEKRRKEKPNKAEGAKSNRLKQETLKSMVEKRSVYSVNHPRAKAITYRVAEMICTDLQPFSVVSDEGFGRLLAELEPRYVLPSRRQFSEVLIPEIFTKVKHRISDLLRLASYITLTTDIWSSTNCSHSFLSLTAHFIVESNMEKKDVMLCAWRFDESHTGNNISGAILSHVRQWDIEDKIVCVLRDNASNMVAAMNSANLKSLPCLAHSLQLIIKDGVLMQPAVQKLLTTARSLVGHYHRSNSSFQNFKKIQSQLNLPDHVLIQDVTTRWNSSYYMLERLVEQRKAITAANTECQPPAELNTQQWLLTEKVIKLLRVFEEATREVSGEYASASIIIPIISALKKGISEDEEDHGIMSMKRGMLKSIQDRYGNVEQESLCVLATILDPRFKLKGFMSASSAAHARMLLITECEVYLKKLQSDNDQPQAKRSRRDSREKSSSALWSLFDELMANSANGDEDDCGTEAEMIAEMYLKEPVISRSEHMHPLQYWQSKKAVWPCLAHLACKYLCIPPSSAASERLFSSASDIISAERNRILPEKAEMLLFIKKNLPVVGY